MHIGTDKITELRREDREKVMQPEMKKLKALEDIADTLEAILIQLTLLTSTVNRRQN